MSSEKPTTWQGDSWLYDAWDATYREGFATALRLGGVLGGISEELAETNPEFVKPYLPEGSELRKEKGFWYVRLIGSVSV